MSTNLTQRRRRPILLRIVGIVVVLAGIAGASVAHRLNSQASTDAVALADNAARFRPNKVHALARLEPEGTVLKISPQSGNDGTRVERLMVREGDDITRGSVVAVLDNERLREAALAEAEARLELAKTRLAQIQAGAKPGDIAAQQFAVELLAEQIKVSERELNRSRELHVKNVVAKEELDRKQWLLDRVTLEHRKAQELLKSVREVREIDVRVAERDVAAAAASVRRAEVDLDSSRVRSPAAGRILKIHTHEGERIGNQGLLELGDVLRMQAVAEIFETDVAQLRVGLKAVVKVDCLSEPITGEIAEIGHRVARKVVLTNDPVSDTDARVVEVRIRLAPSEIERVARLSNARVEVNIELPTK